MAIPFDPELARLAVRAMRRGRRRKGEERTSVIYDFNSRISEKGQQQRRYREQTELRFAEAERRNDFAREMQEARFEEQRAREDRSRAFSMQRATAKQRVKDTPTTRAQFTGPRPSRGGYVEGAAGRSTVSPSGQMTFDPSGVELIDPATGEIDMSRFPMGEGYEAPRPQFVQGIAAETMNPLMEYLTARQHEIPPNQFRGLTALAQTGQLTANQLINQIEDAVKVPKAEGRTTRDIQVNIARLQAALSKVTKFNDPGGRVAGRMASLIQAETRKLDEMQRGTNPIRGHSISNPDPTPGGTPFPPDLMDEYLDRAGGDPYEAEQLARIDGYTF